MKILRLLVPAILLCVMGSNASANILVFGPFYPTNPVGSTIYPTDWGIDEVNTLLTDGSVLIQVPKFSDGGGTAHLNSVTFRLGGTVTSNYLITSTDPTTQSFTFTNSAQLDLLEPGFDPNVGCEGGDPKCLVIDTPANSDTKTLANGDSMSGTLTTSLETTGAAFTGASDLAAFTGTGLISLPVSATGISSVVGGAYTDTVHTSASAYAYVVYDYVPEPGWTAAGGLVVLLAMEIRRRRSKGLGVSSESK